MVTDVTEQEHGRGLKRQLDHLRRLDSLGQLIGGIAHDFNNLFTVVAGSADVIAAEAPRGSTPHQLATEIVDAAVRGRSLAHQLLAFGRAGGHNETVNVPDLLSSVTHLLCRAIGEHIRLDITVPDDLWPVRAERGPLEQVLVNVAANARDSMPRGGVLTISAANTTLEPGHLDAPLAGRVVRLVLADTGTGMDQQTRAHAFEPFYTTKPTAAGLGLTTALNVVSACGGHIRLESTPRLGTTVEIYLPAAERPAQPAAVPADRAADPGHGHVLVVEDQPELAKLIQYLLQPAGYTVTTTTDPHAALARCGPDVHVDLLLTDVIMAGMTGPDLAGALCERYPDLRVVYMTGYPSGDLGPHANLDDEDVLRKPFTRETLLAALERAPAGTRKGNGNTPERKR